MATKKTEAGATTVEKLGLHNLEAAPDSHRNRKRLGRGPGSGSLLSDATWSSTEDWTLRGEIAPWGKGALG